MFKVDIRKVDVRPQHEEEQTAPEEGELLLHLGSRAAEDLPQATGILESSLADDLKSIIGKHLKLQSTSV